MFLVVFFITFLVLLVIGFPIYLGLLGASLAYMLINPQLSITVAIERMINAPNSFPLLAVPFFIFAGQVLNTGGVTSRIFDFAQTLVGHFRGGLGYVNILASVIFSGMSGSALADVGGLGLIEIKAMRDAKYDDDFTLGVTAASATIGPIIPPSIPFVIFGAFANVSIGALFMGGFIPGLLMALALCIMVFIISRKRKYAVSKRASLKDIWGSFKKAILALCAPVIIIGGIWTGFFTPTEAAFVISIYGLFITIFIYKDIKISDIPQMMLTTVEMVAPAIIIVVAAVLFGWIMNYEKVDQALLKALFGLTTNKYIILLIMNIFLFIMGMFLDSTASILLVLPLLRPLTAALGIHPVHFGVILVLNLMIGLLTPPVGFSLYILSSATGYSVEKVTKMVLPWLIPLVITLLIITYIPEIVLFIPRLLGIA